MIIHNDYRANAHLAQQAQFVLKAL